MKLTKHHIGALTAFIALTLAACGGGGTSAPAPVGTPPAPLPGPLTLLKSAQNIQVPSTNGVTGTVLIPGGTGTVNVAVSATAPAGTVALTSVARVVEAKTLDTSSNNTPLVYVAVTASSTASVNGVPGMTLNIPSTAPSGSIFEAIWNGSQWLAVGTAGTVSGSTVTLAGSTATQTVAPGAPLYIVAYVGAVKPSNVIVDGGFEAEGATGFAGATKGWAQCSYLHPNASKPTATPNPAVPAGSITAVTVSATTAPFTVGATPRPTATPVVTPAPSTAPVPNSGNFAALTYTGTGANTTFAAASLAGANGICQTFVVPTSGMLTMQVKEGGNESAGFGDQEAMIFAGGTSALAAAAPSPILVFSELNAKVPAQGATPAPYVLKGPFDLTSAPPAGLGIAAGTTVTLFIGTYDNGPSNTFGEYLLVDDVAVVGFPTQ